MHSAARAAAALRLLASGSLALQLALGLLAVGGLHALVLAVEFLAHGAALGLGGGAGGVALSGVANSLAGRAGVLLAVVLGATDAANGALAVHDALGAGGLFASHFALRARADWVAHCRAGGVIALPAALGVALLSGSEGSESQDKSDDDDAHDDWGWS